MNVLIQFDDQNLDLAACIGNALMIYGSSRPISVKDSDATQSENIRAKEKAIAAAEQGGDPVSNPLADGEIHEFVTEIPAGPGPGEVIPPPVGGVPEDTHGVPHNPDFCVNLDAKSTFYASGKRAGQWIRKRGGDTAAYDAWYASVKPAAEPEAEPGPIDTASAFGGQPAATPETIPADAGAFMLWTSEQQAAGNITQEQVTAAYAQAGLTFANMFNDDEAAIQGHIKTLYGILTAS